mgnify:CR=1 FL=1
MKPKLLLLAASLLGYATGYASINPEEPCKDKAVCIDKKTDIGGTVVHGENKRPLKDVSVTAYLVSKKDKTVQTTDQAGSFGFSDLQPGTYRLVFEKAGFRKITKDKVLIKGDDLFQLNIEMFETGDFDLGPSALHFSDF